MQLKDAKTSTGSFSKAGINQLFLTSWAIADSPYGKQLALDFTDNIGETPRTYKAWVPFKQEFKDEHGGIFKNKLYQYVDVLAAFVGKEKAEQRWNEVGDTMFAVDFDNNDKEAVQSFEEKFVADLFSIIPTNYSTLPINVVLHYTLGKDGKWYLQIPKYKDNKWNVPFGLNPVVSEILIMERPDGTPSRVVTEHEDAPVTVEARQELPGEDLPF